MSKEDPIITVPSPSDLGESGPAPVTDHADIGMGTAQPHPETSAPEVVFHDVDELIGQMNTTELEINKLTIQHGELVSKLRAVQSKIDDALVEMTRRKTEPREKQLQKLLAEIKSLPGIGPTQFEQIENLASFRQQN